MPADIHRQRIFSRTDPGDAIGRKVRLSCREPLFANMILADEINRTPPKTQAALLGGPMQEHPC